MARIRRVSPPNPSKAVVFGFAIAIVVGALLLMLPISAEGPGGSSVRVALFTSTSAICVTGLTVVDTATYFTPFGQGVIVLLIQIGGLGIMTGASLLFLAVSRRIGLRARMITQTERNALNLGDLRRVLIAVVSFSLLAEAVFTLILAVRFWSEGGVGVGTALWRGLFHAVSAFNNAGFSLFSDNLIGYVTDPTVTLAIAFAVIAGGLGFPVWLDMRRRRTTPRRWSLHTKITLVATVSLLLGGWVVLTAIEWNNAGTFGPLSTPGKILAGFFASVVPRTAGFNSIDYGDMHPEGLLITDMLMFVGGGSGSTAGGIKVATFALLAMMAIAEVRGRRDVTAFRRRIPGNAQRQALTIAFAAVNTVVLGALALMVTSGFGFSETLFEAISAFATVGLSTGITPRLSSAGDAVLMGLMYLGRVGPLTLAVALVLREHDQRFRYPEERPLVG
jgi:trk system potassium uptake protein TrkH